jgi:inorganic triphosphatase YgiF
METELKLKISDDEDRPILTADWLMMLVLPDSQQQVNMNSRYYDTPDRHLASQQTTLRIRQENERCVVTVKLGETASQGLHQRLEWSVDLDVEPDWRDRPQIGLDVDWFLREAVSDGDPDELLRERLQVIDGRPLIEVCRADFVRSLCDVGYGGTLMELALDVGQLQAGERTAPIRELELELKEGDVRDLLELGQELIERFHLEPECRSKYARCLDLLAGPA